VKRKHDYFLIDLFVINDVSVKLASRELHENMISFVAYNGIFNLSFHFHLYVNTEERIIAFNLKIWNPRMDYGNF
tara:strand:+ start:163 stop:387 length:225 start_codon:yes stop_codon:yes gene_type:complete